MVERFLCAKALFWIYCEDRPEKVDPFFGQIYIFHIHFAKVVKDYHVIWFTPHEGWLPSN